MADGSAQRHQVIQAVTTPLGFFTLGILVSEAVLLALATMAKGTDFTFLVVGALVCLFLIIVMVFTLTLLPKQRYALTGQTEIRVAGQLGDMNLSASDIRALYSLSGQSSSRVSDLAVHNTSSATKTPEQRARDLEKKGLVRLGHDGKTVWLMEPGQQVVRVIDVVVRAFQKP